MDEARKAKKLKGTFVHTVFFWLKNPDSEADRKKFEYELTTFIDDMEMIIGQHIGTPAGTNRPVIDSSYTYNLLLTFKNREDQDAYQDHPRHKKFIENASDLWEKVVVYDSVKM